jgi:polysaccharide biosynthesis transport protein
MKVIEILRLLRKHIVILLVVPLLLASVTTLLLRKPKFIYTSETTIYTGIASGNSVDVNKSISYFAENTTFDNLINLIKSRETQQEVAIRLLAMHLMMDSYDPRFISMQSFDNLKKETPPEIFKLIAKKGSVEIKTSNKKSEVINENIPAVTRTDSILKDSLASGKVFSFNRIDTADMGAVLPPSVDREAYEQTVKNLMDYLNRNDTNYIYRLLYFHDPHYSTDAIGTVNVQRISSSDLVKLIYDNDDPGICQQTLILLTEVCVKNFKKTKENRTDAVVKYFEYQLKQAGIRLKLAEDGLLKFNEDNKIINYYEQSKAVANVKENLDGDYNNKRIKLAESEAGMKQIEEKLNIQQKIQLKSSSLLEKRNRLSEITTRIANAEILYSTDTSDNKNLADLKLQEENVKNEIRESVNDLYRYGNSKEGLPVNNLLTDWIRTMIDYEETKAGLTVLGDRIKEFQKQYSIYAPAGANLKRIEREISVAESEYLEILHGLNLAKLRVQDAELSSNIKAIDKPYFPLSPNPTKRKILIALAGIIGFLLLLIIILAMEYFDNTLHTLHKAAKKLHLQPAGIFPKILLHPGSFNFIFVSNLLLEKIIQKIKYFSKEINGSNEPCVILICSTLNNEGKTTILGNLALKLKLQGKKVIALDFSRDSLRETELSQVGYQDKKSETTISSKKTIHQFNFLRKILGYPDPRVDENSPFLDSPENYLTADEFHYYQINKDYFSIHNYKELLEKNNIQLADTPDYVLIEIPAILYYPYPIGLMNSCNNKILVCRANRVWSTADQGAMDTFTELVSTPPQFILNGVEMNAIEEILGDLPKKRSKLRRAAKRLIRFQFFSRQLL